MSRFVDKTLDDVIGYISQSIYSEKYSKKNGLLQGMDCRAKLVAFLFLIFAAVYVRTIEILLLFLLLSAILAVSSKISLSFYIPRVWLFIPLFTGVIAIPATLNVVTPGTEIVKVLSFNGWYLSITREGAHAAAILVIRVASTSSFAILLTLTTRWNDAVDAMHSLRLPKIFVLILSMSYRYIFLLLDMTKKMLLSRKSRILGKERSVSSWKLYSPIVAALFMKSFSFDEEVYFAMLTRGFGNKGEISKYKNIDIKSAVFLILCISMAMLLVLYERLYPPAVLQWLFP